MEKKEIWCVGLVWNLADSRPRESQCFSLSLQAREDQCWEISGLAGVPSHSYFLFYSGLWLDVSHLHSRGLSYLLHLIQILLSSRNILTDTPRIMFIQKSEYPPDGPVKLIHKINDHKFTLCQLGTYMLLLLLSHFSRVRLCVTP